LTAKQKENEAYKVEILGIISEEAHTVSEILKLGNFPPEMTNQRISAIVKQMIEADLVARTEKDRKAYFKAVEVEG
jgi:DNA-binding transcriptional regulator GbsR (MarR family)